jgi:uncharacterized protein
MLSFDVSPLLKAPLGKSLTLSLEAGHQVLEDLEVVFLHGSAQAVRAEKGIFVSGTVESRLRLECGRCLQDSGFPVTLALEEMFRMPGAAVRPDAIYAVGEDLTLDLEPLIRELAWLAVPMRPLCDPECKGLCPHCGANRNTEVCQCEEMRVDPRLAVLKELL